MVTDSKVTQFLQEWVFFLPIFQSDQEFPAYPPKHYEMSSTIPKLRRYTMSNTQTPQAVHVQMASLQSQCLLLLVRSSLHQPEIDRGHRGAEGKPCNPPYLPSVQQKNPHSRQQCLERIELQYKEQYKKVHVLNAFDRRRFHRLQYVLY